ncbi:MAG: ZIP family metal transporter [Deltaproteobacteria bacterium]|nr:ZIP family metal transporter [Deltaproteobacteria bacterium]
MSLLGSIVLATVIAGVASTLLAGLFLLVPERARGVALPAMVSFAIGSLLGAAFIGLLPEAFIGLGPEHGERVGGVVVAGLLAFFVLEKYLLWRHCHQEPCAAHPVERSMAGGLVVVGDSIHNFVDGLLIAAAFLSDPSLGFTTAAAVAAHEIPQEMGDFAVLLHSGFSRRKALLFNVGSGLAMVGGGVVGYLALAAVEQAVPYALAFAAASFVYVAAADLIPAQHRRLGLRAGVQQLALITAGAAQIWLVHGLHHG